MPARPLWPLAAALVAAAACGTGGAGPSGSGPPVDFTIGTLDFHISSGAAVTSGGVLTLHLSDQVETCLALIYVPVRPATTLSLGVAPAADGTTQATVVGLKPVPGAGEAVGGLRRATGGVQSASIDAADGTVAWTPGASGSVTVTSIDVGFAGVAGRVATGPLTLPGCVL
jgi:hypothetical protein